MAKEEEDCGEIYEAIVEADVAEEEVNAATDNAAFAASIAGVSAGLRYFSPDDFTTVGDNDEFNALPSSVRRVSKAVVRMRKCLPDGTSTLGTGTLFAIGTTPLKHAGNEDFKALIATHDTSQPLLCVMTNYHVAFHTKRGHGIREAQLGNLGKLNLDMTFEHGAQKLALFSDYTKPTVMALSAKRKFGATAASKKSAETGAAAMPKADPELDAVILCFPFNDTLTEMDRENYQAALEIALDMVAFLRAEKTVTLDRDLSGTEHFVPYMIGHPLGCAKRVSTIHGTVDTLRAGAGEGSAGTEGHARHRCASYPGNSGSPIVYLASESAHKALTGAGFHVGAEMAVMAEQRGRLDYNLVMLHWGRGGQGAAIKSVADIFRTLLGSRR